MKLLYLLLPLILIACGGDQNKSDEIEMLAIFDKFVEQNDQGGTIPNASVQVNVQGGGPAVIYSNKSGSTIISNPTTSDSDGRVTFYALPGEYQIIITGSEGSTTYENVVLTEPFDGTAIGDIEWTINEVATAQDFALAGNDDGTHFVLTGSGTYNITINSNSSTPFSDNPRVKFSIDNPSLNDTTVNILNGANVEFDRDYFLLENLEYVEMYWLSNLDGLADRWGGITNITMFKDTNNKLDYDDSGNRLYFGDGDGNDALRVPVSGSTPAQVWEPKTDSLRDITTEYERLYEQTTISAQPWNLNTTFRRRHNVTLDNLEIGLNASATPSIFSPQQVHTQNYPVTIIQNGATGLVDLYGDAIALPFVIPQGQLWEFEGSTGGNYKAYRIDASSGKEISNYSVSSYIHTMQAADGTNSTDITPLNLNQWVTISGAGTNGVTRRVMAVLDTIGRPVKWVIPNINLGQNIAGASTGDLIELRILARASTISPVFELLNFRASKTAGENNVSAVSSAAIALDPLINEFQIFIISKIAGVDTALDEGDFYIVQMGI